MEVVTAGKQEGMTGHSALTGFGYGFATLQNPSWTLDQVLLATGGRLLSGNIHAAFRSIATDSRTVKPGDLFLALSGENYDGIAFIAEAYKNGATGVIVSRQPEQRLPVPVILVQDTLRALGDLAGHRRALIRGLNVLAVTGSSGKTTVKDIAAGILSHCGCVIKTKGNFNNLIGLPLSLLPVTYRTDFAVLEMGMNMPGEITRLTEIADPDVVCINNIQPAHLAGLGSIQGVAKAKGELFTTCRSTSILVVNRDDAKVSRLARKIKAEKITFGRKKQAYVRATHLYKHGEKGMSFTLHLGSRKERIRIQGLGEHNVSNSLAAGAMAYAAGADLSDIVEGLESFRPQTNRLSLSTLPCGLKIINDSYNANPSSMQAALNTVNSLKKSEKTLAVLGDMLELGEFSAKAHCQIGDSAARQGFDYLLAVGDYAGEMVAAARRAGMKENAARFFVTKDELTDYLLNLWKKSEINQGDIVLVKGSRGMRMEMILEGLNRMLC